MSFLCCRNKSSCSKIAMRLTVLRPDEVVRAISCEPPVATTTTQVTIPLQSGEVLDCPDVTKVADSKPNVTWLYMKPSSSVIQSTMKAPSCREHPD